MKMTYKKDTLYIDIVEGINPAFMTNLRHRLFNVIDDYNIDNIVINIVNKEYDNELVNGLLASYYEKYQGNLSIK